MKKLFTIVLLALFVFTGYSSYAQKHAKHRVVMQLTSSDTAVWKGVINNIKNMRKGWGKDVEIEVVSHGPGVGFLLNAKTTQHEAIKALKAEGVTFVICENSMRERKIEKSEVIEEAGYVPMGVGEVVMKQEQGWSYLKAGF